jgi:hypothetical protein
MTPQNGGRIELRLGPSSSDAAEYEAHLKTASAAYRGRARVGASAADKQVEFGAWALDEAQSGALEPPAWLTADARAALKAALRTSQVEGRWPRRITRWRPEPSE